MSRKAGVYSDFVTEVLEMAKQRGYTAVSMDIEWGNNPSARIFWRAPVDEKFDSVEVRKGLA